MATLRIDWDRGKIKEYVLWTETAMTGNIGSNVGSQNILFPESPSQKIFLSFLYTKC
jgi:hypothetical protein